MSKIDRRAQGPKPSPVLRNQAAINRINRKKVKTLTDESLGQTQAESGGNEDVMGLERNQS